MKPSSQAGSDVKKHIASILFPILYSLMLFIIATIIYFYANGYRLDLSKQQITQTGVVDVEGSILGANVYVNNKLIGKTPKSTSLDVGNYQITVKRDGYYDWDKNITINEGKSTPLDAWLVKQQPGFTTLWTSQGEIEQIWEDNNKDHIVFLTKETDGYSLWEYSINPALLDFSDNPMKILQTANSNFTISISPNGLSALMSVTSDKGIIQEYLLDTQHLNNLTTLKPLNIDSTKGYKITWSLDNNYLILESNTEISAYNIKQNTTSLLITKTSTQSVWATDDQGFFYIIEPQANTTTQMNVYKLKEISLDGTVNKYIIDNFYFNNTDEYIKQYRTNGFSYTEFTTSPESTMSAGQIASITVNQKAQGMFISTSLATYWFDVTTQKFIMVSAYPGKLISFNSTPDKFIYQDEKYLSIFTFKKIEGDESTSIGSKVIGNIQDMTKVSNLDWVYNLDYIYYVEDGLIYSSDKDGDNKSYISASNDLLAITNKELNKTFITFTRDSENKLSITSIDTR